MENKDITSWILLTLFLLAFGLFNFKEYFFLKEIKNEVSNIRVIIENKIL